MSAHQTLAMLRNGADEHRVHTAADALELQVNASLQIMYVQGWWWGLTCGVLATTLLWALLYIAWQAVRGNAS